MHALVTSVRMAMQCDYQCRDLIADAVNPGLALLALAVLAFSPAVRRYGRSRFATLCAVGLGAAYTLQWLDGVLSIWPRWGADYSGHLAFALAITTALSPLGRRWTLAATAVLVLYSVLMVHQRYHTWLDLLSTAPPITLAVLLAHRARTRRQRAPLTRPPVPTAH